jgi:thermitase
VTAVEEETMPATRAFSPDDYPETRTRKEIAAERKEVARQVESLLRLARDEEYRHRAVQRLQARRCPQPRRLQMEEVPRAGRTNLLVASGSVVARRADLVASARRRLRDDFGIDTPETDRRVVRLDVPADRLRDGGITGLIASMCGCGAPVRPNHVVPLAGVMKGAGGPEPSAGARPFPAVAFPADAAPVVAVLDTGVSEERRPDGYLSMPVARDDLDLLDDFPPDGLLDAGAGHGAFVTGVVQQVAPGTTVQVHRVLDTDGITSDVDVADRMRRAVEEGAQILNMSLGTETVDDRPPAALLDVVSDLAETHPDVLIVCAAGNGASTERIWPAAFAATMPNVVAVTGLDPAGNGAVWSTHGDWVTCSAIGEGVVSTYVEGREDGALIGDPDPDTYGPGAWATWTGTSFAAPQVSGAIARICAQTGATPPRALSDLLGRGTTMAGYGQALRILPGT